MMENFPLIKWTVNYGCLIFVAVVLWKAIPAIILESNSERKRNVALKEIHRRASGEPKGLYGPITGCVTSLSDRDLLTALKEALEETEEKEKYAKELKRVAEVTKSPASDI